MNRWLFLSLLLVPLLAVFLAVEGCGKKDKKATTSAKGGDDGGGDDGSDDDKETPKKPLAAKGFATLQGVVYFDGKTPTRKVIVYKDFDPKQRVICMENKDQATDPTWKVYDADGKNVVKNAVIFLKPPKDYYFKINPKQKDWKSEVVIDQPHCAFVPHVAVTFPKYFDGKDWVESGQKLRIRNSAPFPHNTKWSSPKNRENTETLAKKNSKGIMVKLNPDTVPVTIQCDIHKWMKGQVWAFPHPYAAKTKEDGTYKIRVPAGVKFTVIAWHEARGEFKEVPMQLKKGETKKLNFKVSQGD
jgi:hypothetical protein